MSPTIRGLMIVVAFAYDNIISRTDAGALIPESVAKGIWKNVPQKSAALTTFRNVRLATRVTRQPVLSALPVAYFVNGDTGMKQTTEVNWDNKFWTVEEIACIVPIPDAVVDDLTSAGVSVWGEVQPAIEEAIGRALDAAVWFGVDKPSTWPEAIVPAAIAAGNTAVIGTNDTAHGGIVGDISDLMATIEGDGYDADMFIAKHTIKGMLRNARNTQGNRLGEVTPTSIDGIPVTYPLKGLWPSGDSSALLIAGDRAYGMIGIRQDISWKILDQAVITDNSTPPVIIYNLPQQDMIALRCTFRVAYQVANPINYLEPNEEDRYPFGVLLTPEGA